MRRGSTPILNIHVSGQAFDGCTVVVTLDQDGTQVTKSNNAGDLDITKNYDDAGEFTGSTIAVYLTQEETLKFDIGVIRAQIRWIDVLGNAFVSNISTTSIDEVLLERVIEYGE